MTIKKKYFWYCIVGVVAVNHNEKVTKSVLSQSLFGWLVSKQVSELGCMDMISVRVRMSVVVTAVMVMLLIRTTAKMGGQTNRTERLPPQMRRLWPSSSCHRVVVTVEFCSCTLRPPVKRLFPLNA